MPPPHQHGHEGIKDAGTPSTHWGITALFTKQ